MLENEVKIINTAITSIAGCMKQQQKGEILESFRTSLNELSLHPITILVCGEFKRGKSTFINALIGNNVCPTDVDICTSVVSIIKYGDKEKATRLYGDFSNLQSQEINFDDIERYTVGSASEIDNTVCVEIEMPLDKLKDSLIIIDTPGVGGLDPRHALLTNYFMPRADIALFLTDVNEPLTTTELAFYKNSVLQNAQCSAIIVNKSDLKDAKSVEDIKMDTISKISVYTQCSRDSIRAITVSSADCIREESGLGNFSEVYELINSLVFDYKGSVLESLRDDLVEEIRMMVSMLKQQLSQYENPDMSALQELLKKKQDLNELLDSLSNPNSEFRLGINKSIAREKETITKVLNTFNMQMTSDTLSKLVSNKNAHLENGGEWVGKMLGNEMMAFDNELTKMLNASFNRITKSKEFEGMLNFSVSSSQVEVQACNVDLSVSARKHLMGALSGFSPVSMVGGGVTAAVSMLFAPAGIIAGLAASVAAIWSAVDSHNETINGTIESRLKQTYLPKIQLSLQNLRIHVDSRFNDFQRELIRVVTERIKNIRNTIAQTIEEIQKIQQDINSRVNKKVALQNQVKVLENCQNQLEALKF